MIKILAVGKIKDKNLLALIKDYQKRIAHFDKIEIIELKDYPGENNELMAIESECESIMAKIKDNEYLILLDLHGSNYSSPSFAKELDTIYSSTNTNITFVIGGSYGLSDKLRIRANLSWKLSDLTFPHQIVRLLLLEQIYRAFKINNNHKYHK
ncbi:MAG: 23S rRNA (pseudouridine(1915)-N(3))-methyltransferase RlmH [Erysipelotrichaceae bacterium]